ncbi:MAG: tetratricopeptide repeat protein, partial [Acidobacteria bacterium]|nr:tetratricopeptide repeat protein [Acidobacteriota bacterium]
ASYEESRQILERDFGPGHYAVLVNLAGIASVRLRQGSPQQAEALLRGWLETWGQGLSSPYLRGLGESVLGEALVAQGRVEEAEPLLATSYEAILESQGPASEKTREALRRLEELPRVRSAPR